MSMIYLLIDFRDWSVIIEFGVWNRGHNIVKFGLMLGFSFAKLYSGNDDGVSWYANLTLYYVDNSNYSFNTQ